MERPNQNQEGKPRRARSSRRWLFDIYPGRERRLRQWLVEYASEDVPMTDAQKEFEQEVRRSLAEYDSRKPRVKDVPMKDAPKEQEGLLEEAPKLQKLLYALRVFIECRHRKKVLDESVCRPYSPILTPDRRKIDKEALVLEDNQHYVNQRQVYDAIEADTDLPVPGRHGFEGMLGCGNKTVPIYVFARDHTSPFPMAARRPDLFQELDSYIYQAWFRPFKTHIDCDQYFAKVIVPRLQPRTDQIDQPSWINLARDYVGVALTLSKGLCESFEQMQGCPRIEERIPQFQCFKIRPLFRALAIVILEQDYNACCYSGNRIDKMRVLLISTGSTDGLTAPITLPNAPPSTSKTPLPGPSEKKVTNISIEITTLSSAISFIISLESREKASSGQLDLSPVPALRWLGSKPSRGYPPFCHSYLRSMSQPFANSMGWTYESIDGPSCNWVDLTKYHYPPAFQAKTAQAIMNFSSTDPGKYHAWQCEKTHKTRIVSWWKWHSRLSVSERDETAGRRSGVWIFRVFSGLDDELALAYITSRPMLVATGH